MKVDRVAILDAGTQFAKVPTGLMKFRDIYYAKYYGKGEGNGQLGKKIKN